MTQILLDEALRTKLLNLAQPLELIDETGRVVGRVLPAVDLSQYEPWEPELDEEELRRREKSDKWYTTAQVLAHLKSLEQK
jgi:hypothetical protein